jgi:hypothetical protein
MRGGAQAQTTTTRMRRTIFSILPPCCLGFSAFDDSRSSSLMDLLDLLRFSPQICHLRPSNFSAVSSSGVGLAEFSI